MRLGERRNRADADLLAVEQREPVRERAASRRRPASSSLAAQPAPGSYCRAASSGAPSELADAGEEDWLERGERQVRPSAVAYVS